MEISLIRHGKSMCTNTNRIPCKEFEIGLRSMIIAGFLKKTLIQQKRLKK